MGPFSSRTIVYGDASDTSTQTSVDIQYYADVLRMGAATIANQTFGVVVESNGQSQGHPRRRPRPAPGFTRNSPYSLVLNSLQVAGVIASRVFTLDLRHQDEVGGALIYGGLDKNRFTGPLVKVPSSRVRMASTGTSFFVPPSFLRGEGGRESTSPRLFPPPSMPFSCRFPCSDSTIHSSSPTATRLFASQ